MCHDGRIFLIVEWMMCFYEDTLEFNELLIIHDFHNLKFYYSCGF